MDVKISFLHKAGLLGNFDVNTREYLCKNLVFLYAVCYNTIEKQTIRSVP